MPVYSRRNDRAANVKTIVSPMGTPAARWLLRGSWAMSTSPTIRFTAPQTRHVTSRAPAPRRGIGAARRGQAGVRAPVGLDAARPRPSGTGSARWMHGSAARLLRPSRTHRAVAVAHAQF
ncbi:hypothetical protein GUJ93_ZPchr0007g3841 [Zizania palustris]|uniref:Uncharacterized protein n=1 Tax=Zizania palustris TaxID=103762 RepID=A0A8J5T539_ZIZPA|nr:hypothetical protein GUJ93_ZPchr0007g3841 [Zizania palustris]